MKKTKLEQHLNKVFWNVQAQRGCHRPMDHCRVSYQIVVYSESFEVTSWKVAKSPSSKVPDFRALLRES
jgi:hypothetical protein